MAEFDISDANLPFNIDAEQIVLGSIIIEPELLSRVSDKLSPEHFHIRSHAKIYGVINMLFVSGEEINIVSVTESCVRQSVFETVDETRTYLFKLTESSVEKSSIESYARILEESSLCVNLFSLQRISTTSLFPTLKNHRSFLIMRNRKFTKYAMKRK